MSLSAPARRLRAAARSALHAPSVFNSQPWSWRINGDTLLLYADRSRQLHSIDPDGRLLMISCGAALHHARTALAADGWSAEVECLPGAGHPDLLARIRLGAAVPPGPRTRRTAGAIRRRRTDRRPFGDRAVPENLLTRLRRCVELEGAYLHVVRQDQVPALAVACEHAAGAEHEDPAYLADLDRWTDRPAWRGDGVPAGTAVRPALRRVPVRDFAPGGTAGLVTGTGVDKGAAYVILFGSADQPGDLLRAGEALSALLLLATAEGLASATLSEAVEVSWPRLLLRDLLSGLGEPYLAVRLGYRVSGQPVPATPRRFPAEAIKVVAPRSG
ncbi:nitroreductase [Actinoplanes sp. NPDC048967]|uniref:Acg family FMN-binding oxidoreductase n=1 Tax=Actinoplanes sp. NPDC048967 TaxID=3155269 RepID=UPI00340799EE